MSGKYNSQNGDTEVKNGGVNIYTNEYMQHDLLDMKPYGVRRRRRQKQGLVSQSDVPSYNASSRLYTSRENDSFRLPCQFSDFGGTRKELSEDAESAEPTKDKMTRLRL